MVMTIIKNKNKKGALKTNEHHHSGFFHLSHTAQSRKRNFLQNTQTIMNNQNLLLPIYCQTGCNISLYCQKGDSETLDLQAGDMPYHPQWRTGFGQQWWRTQSNPLNWSLNFFAPFDVTEIGHILINMGGWSALLFVFTMFIIS